MLDWVLKTVGGLVFVFGAMYLIGDLFQRLPPKMKEEHGGLGATRFGFWGRVKSFNWTDYRVGYVSGWDVGHELMIYAEGNASQGDENVECKATFLLYANLDAYTQTNIIGWADFGTENQTIRLTFRPEQVRDILNELRINPDLNIHVHGWKGEKSHLIEFFSIEP